MDRLAVLDKRTRDQEDYLATLILLVEDYEGADEDDTDDIEPLEVLKYLMQGHGMSASDLGRLLGERTLGPAIVRGDRELSKTHIRILCKHFGVGPELFFKI